MFLNTQAVVEHVNYEYMQSFKVEEETRIQDLKKICRYLEDVCMQRGVQFVHGRGKRKSKTQKDLEQFRVFLERQIIYDWHTASFNGRNNYSKTDPDATFMHMKDDSFFLSGA